MLTHIEDLDFSHGSEEDDGEWSARLYGLGTILKETGLTVTTSSTSTSTSGTAVLGTICHRTLTTRGKRAAARLPCKHPRIMKDFVG